MDAYAKTLDAFAKQKDRQRKKVYALERSFEETQDPKIAQELRWAIKNLHQTERSISLFTKMVSKTPQEWRSVHGPYFEPDKDRFGVGVARQYDEYLDELDSRVS